MQSQYILPIVLGIGVGVLSICVIILLYRLSLNRKKDDKDTKKKEKKAKSLSRTPTIERYNIPGFALPTWRNVRIQEPLRRNLQGGLIDDVSSDEYDLEYMRPRSSAHSPVSTVMKTGQYHSDEGSLTPTKMEPASPLTTKSRRGMSGSISLQDLNVYAPKTRLRHTMSEVMLPSLKFALYYSAASGELNVTVISVSNMGYIENVESLNLCVWVQVEFSKYHQEFRTKQCSGGGHEIMLNETCVVSDFPVEHFTGSRISFRVIVNDSKVVAEAVHVVLGVPPSFPKNESIDLQHPGIVECAASRSRGEIFIRLKYDPVDETVTLGIVECRGLQSVRKKNKLLDTYVKVQVISSDASVQKYKTKLVTKNNNPRFDKTITITGLYSSAKMAQTQIKLTVVTKSIPKHSIGFVTLGQDDDITSSGSQHWESIIDKPSLEIVQWHALKSTRSTTP